MDTHVEMEVIAMGFVVIGTEHDVEEPAGAISDVPQKSRAAGITSRPVASHRDLLSVCQHEACEIDCIGGRMFAAPTFSAVIDVAAGVSAEMDDAHHILPEMSASRWSDDVAVKERPGDSERT